MLVFIHNCYNQDKFLRIQRSNQLQHDLNILVVDDSTIQRQLICKIIINRDDSTNLFEAADGTEALEMVRRGNQFDLIITDFNMPNMNGLELIKNIRNDSELSDIPIIIISAEVSKENMLEAIEAGANMEILKPFTPADLNKSVDYVLNIQVTADDPKLTELNIRIKELEQENQLLKEKLEQIEGLN